MAFALALLKDANQQRRLRGERCAVEQHAQQIFQRLYGPARIEALLGCGLLERHHAFLRDEQALQLLHGLLHILEGERTSSEVPGRAIVSTQTVCRIGKAV